MFQRRTLRIFGFLKYSSVVRYYSDACGSSKSSKSGSGSSTSGCGSSKGSSSSSSGGSSSKGSGSSSCSCSGSTGSSGSSSSGCSNSKGSSSSSSSSTSGDKKDTICPPCSSFYDSRKFGHNLPCDSVQPHFETLPGIPTGIFRCTNGEILGRGADKCCLYPNPEYFSYNHMTFYDIHLYLRPCRQPSPISGRKK